jgi:hypothetical protein
MHELAADDRIEQVVAPADRTADTGRAAGRVERRAIGVAGGCAGNGAPTKTQLAAPSPSAGRTIGSMAAFDELEERLRASATFEPTGERAGAAGLLEVRHRASGLRFVVAPGGTYEMGWSADEMREALARFGVAPGAPGADHYRPIFEAAYERARPVERVAVEPFLCARHPLPDALAPERLRGRTLDVPTREYFPDVAEWDAGFASVEDTDDFGVDEEDAPDWMSEELAMRAGPGAEPVMLHAREIGPVLRGIPGTRLMTSAEWEYVARAGGARRWLDDPGSVSRHPFGIRGLFFGTWIGAPNGSPSARGGAFWHYPFQDAAEAIDLHCAWRPPRPPAESDLHGLQLAATL